MVLLPSTWPPPMPTETSELLTLHVHVSQYCGLQCRLSQLCLLVETDTLWNIKECHDLRDFLILGVVNVMETNVHVQF